MQLTSFGNTGLQVSGIGLGLAALGRPGYINLGHGEDLQANYEPEAMKNHTHRMLDLAYRSGVRYFDAARSYGRAEEFLSEWARSKHDIVVGSKWGYTYSADWKVEAEEHEIKDHSIEVLDRQWQESTAHLGKHLNIYHIHSASIESGVLENNKVIERLWSLRERGLVIGLSTSGPRQGDTLERSLEHRQGGRQLFQSVQITWNLLERSAITAIEKARQAGYGIIVKESLANGRLTARNQEEDFDDKKRALQQIADQHDSGIDAVAIAWVLRQSWVSVVLSGAATTEHLRSNLEGAEMQLTADDLAVLEDMTEAPEQYWQTRAQLAWN
jgi:aryl-alcohol dehydrogenase-like predicted oxidoreductase